MPFLRRPRRRAVALAVGPALEALDRALDQTEEAAAEHEAAIEELLAVLEREPHP